MVNRQATARIVMASLALVCCNRDKRPILPAPELSGGITQDSASLHDDTSADGRMDSSLSLTVLIEDPVGKQLPKTYADTKWITAKKSSHLELSYIPFPKHNRFIETLRIGVAVQAGEPSVVRVAGAEVRIQYRGSTPCVSPSSTCAHFVFSLPDGTDQICKIDSGPGCVLSWWKDAGRLHLLVAGR